MACQRGTLMCEGSVHTIRWQRGAVVLEDHADPLAELALCVLGATWTPCIAVLSLLRRGFDPVGTWPVWSGPLPRASGPELMWRAWDNLGAARGGGAGGDAAAGVEGAEDRWAMAVLGLVDPPLRRRLALDAVVARCRRPKPDSVHVFGSGTTLRGLSRRDGRGVLAESIMMSSIGAPPGATLLWLLESAGDPRVDRLRAAAANDVESSR